MPADIPTPLQIGRVPEPERSGEVAFGDDAADLVGRAAAGMLRHLIAVLDREDRLESGTGEWLADLSGDGAALAASVRDAVLRAVQMATDPANYRILVELARTESITRATLADRLGLTELSVAERVGDLVSAGFAVKVPEANQIAGTTSGAAFAKWVRRAVVAGTDALEEER